ncbi:hypothetical protein [Streptomyces sp. NPDC090036]|uniref:hypothetical protein n=1 Tax=Streptomyces sp. NPDC090036 TaxID=3365926 RepID=UPI00381F4AA9
MNPVTPVNWADLVPGPPALAPYYDEVPGLTGVRLRSVHADGWGSCVILRLDLPRFPDRWDGGPGDTLQCQIGFSHVGDQWEPHHRLLGRRLRRHRHPRVPARTRVSALRASGR